jgi:fructokinase
MYDVTALGELLIDFTDNGVSADGNPIFEANPGGAPCNVLAMVSRLGYSTAFIGKVGNDAFGKMLGKTICDLGIETEGLVYDDTAHTTLAFVQTLADGDRDFSFYRKAGADIRLQTGELCMTALHHCRIFHFGTLSLTDEPAATATKMAVIEAKQSGAIISFDPNIRQPLWQNMEDARRAAWYGIGLCDILKIADNEIAWLTGTSDYIEGVRILRQHSQAKLINVTLGKKGSLSFYDTMIVSGPPFTMEHTINTTGAGDTFCACVLAYVLTYGLDHLSQSRIEAMLRFANGAAALITTRKGALRAMPSKSEILDLIRADKA